MERGSTERSEKMERYRSGRTGIASKAICRESGTWVRIPPSPPPFAKTLASLAGYLSAVARRAKVDGWQAQRFTERHAKDVLRSQRA